jgi:hypothetical protein
MVLKTGQCTALFGIKVYFCCSKTSAGPTAMFWNQQTNVRTFQCAFLISNNVHSWNYHAFFIGKRTITCQFGP